MRELPGVLADLVLPRRCVGCGRPRVALCGRCAPGDARQIHITDLDVVAAGVYSGGLRRALIAYKERGRRDLTRALGLLLGAAVRAALLGSPTGGFGGPGGRFLGSRVALVPVPSSRAAAAARGGDHLARLARHAGASVVGARASPGTLELTRAVRDSSGLGVAARAENIHGAFRARAAPSGRIALLVDDIVTTGATLREARRALVDSGWVVAGAAVIGATPRTGAGTP